MLSPQALLPHSTHHWVGMQAVPMLQAEPWSPIIGSLTSASVRSEAKTPVTLVPSIRYVVEWTLQPRGGRDD